jgi:hypothetical protein
MGMITFSGLSKIKKTGLLFFFFLCGTFAYAQGTVTRDTIITLNDKVEITFTISEELDSIAEITIEHFSIMGADTISVFYGAYNMDDDDPSAFHTLEIDEINDTIILCIGKYEDEDLYSVINITHASGIEEEFIIN